MDVPTEAINLVAQYCVEASRVNPDAVIAIIADQDLIYGLSRMFQVLAEETGWEIEIFRLRDDAEAWIKKRVKEKFGIYDLTMA